MTTNTPSTRKVKLKSVATLKRGDAIVPGLGLFTRSGARIVSGLAMSDSWGRGTWYVTGAPWMNDLPEMNVPISASEPTGAASDIIHTPLDAFVVLANTEA